MKTSDQVWNRVWDRLRAEPKRQVDEEVLDSVKHQVWNELYENK
jgi:hypothetical protein